MRLLVLIFLGLIAAAVAPDYFRRPSAPPPAPPYVNGKPVMAAPDAQPNRSPEESAAEAVHRTALNGVFEAFDIPFAAKCGSEARQALAAAFTSYYRDPARLARSGWKTSEDTRVEFMTRISFSQRY